jgi:hypothetical protein
LCSSVEGWTLNSVLLLNAWLLLLLGTVLLLGCHVDSSHQGVHISGVLSLHLLLECNEVGLLLDSFCLLLSKKVCQPCWRLILAPCGATLVVVVVHSGSLLVDELLETFTKSLVSRRGAPGLCKTEVERVEIILAADGGESLVQACRNHYCLWARTRTQDVGTLLR